MLADIEIWLNLCLRWFHVMAAILWIGTSFFFIWLDNDLQFEPGYGEGYVGKAWLFHAGGYYEVNKSVVAKDKSILDKLHWFKWEAYLTWISGFLLLTVIFFLHPTTYMVDTSLANITGGEAVLIGIGALLIGWLVYDGLCRTLGKTSPKANTLVLLLLYLGATWVLTHVLAGQAAYLLSGAMLGTVMAFNVAFVIMPGQRKMYAAQNRGEVPDPKYSKTAKQRSTHNNYLTLPVLFTMISNHYAMTYGDKYRWIVLVLLTFVGFGVDYFLNTRDKEHKGMGYAAVAAAFVGVVVAGFLTSMPATPAQAAGAVARAKPVAFSTVNKIIHERCAVCHSAHPTSPSFTSAPMGIEFDTPAEIKQHAVLIKQMAVTTHAMPLGNITKMTDKERQTLATWLAQGANINAKAATP